MSSSIQCPVCKQHFKCLLQHLRVNRNCGLYSRMKRKADQMNLGDELEQRIEILKQYQDHTRQGFHIRNFPKHQKVPKIITASQTQNDETDNISMLDDNEEIQNDNIIDFNLQYDNTAEVTHLLHHQAGQVQDLLETIHQHDLEDNHVSLEPSLDTNRNQMLTAQASSTTNQQPANHTNLPLVYDYASSGYNFLFTPSERSMMRFYDLLDYIAAPRYLMDVLMHTMQQEMLQNGFDPRRDIQKRASFVKKMTKRFPTPPPIIEKVALEGTQEDREVVDVIHFDFEAQLSDLLNDHEMFGNRSNLVVNSQDVWKQYNPVPHDKLDEVLDGQWYHETCGRLLTQNTMNEFVLPIIFYVDKTGTNIQQRHGLEPLVFTTAILNRKTRNTTRAWRMLGFIPDLDLSSKAAKSSSQQKKEGKGRSTRNYHKCLDVILRSFKKAQQKKPNLWLRLGKSLKKVYLHLPLAFVIGDGKSNDHLCGRYGGHRTNRACRACTVSFSSLDNPNHQCQWLQFSTVNRELQCVLSETSTDVRKNKQERTYTSYHHMCVTTHFRMCVLVGIHKVSLGQPQQT